MDTPENICKFVMNPGTEEDIEMMKEMLQDKRISSPNVTCKQWYNGTALMYQSSFNGTFEAMRFLIDEGVYINITNDLKETALFWAVQCSIETGLREKTILLLREGAKVWGLKDYKGITVIEACDNPEMKEVLQIKADDEFVLNEQEKRDRIKRTERAEAEAKQKQTLVEAESKQKQTLAEAEAKTSSDPDEEKYQKIEMTRFKGGKTKNIRRKRRKTRKPNKSKKSRKTRK